MPQIQISVAAALLPTSNFPIRARHQSSGTGNPEVWVLEFPDSVDRRCFVEFKVPSDYSSNPKLNLIYHMESALSGAVRWNGKVMCATENADDLDDAGADLDNATNDTVPGTAGYWKEVSITLTNADGIAADDLCNIMIERQGTNAGDTASGKARLRHIIFEYTAS